MPDPKLGGFEEEAPAPRNLELVLEYSGESFAGWQVQPDCRTVQGEVERAIAQITREQVRVVAASRTDTGVHALGQVVSFPSNSDLSCDRLRSGLNAVLPPEVAVRRVREVEPDFHARFSAKGKHYCYRILNRVPPSPVEKGRSWHVDQSLDVPAMQEAADWLVGTHDFRAFASRPDGDRDCVRTLHAVRVSGRSWLEPCGPEGSLVCIDVAGDGFLYKMVRTIAGTLCHVGRRKLEPVAVKRILESKQRSQAGPTAPPQGLFLVRVFYCEDELTVPFQSSAEGVDSEDQHHRSRRGDPRQHEGVRGAEGREAGALL